MIAAPSRRVTHDVVYSPLGTTRSGAHFQHRSGSGTWVRIAAAAVFSAAVILLVAALTPTAPAFRFFSSGEGGILSVWYRDSFSAGGFFSFWSREPSPPAAVVVDERCGHCAWTSQWACPGGAVPGTEGWAAADGTVCFEHCCPNSCHLLDQFGNCLQEEAAQPVPYADALERKDGYLLTNIDLAEDCRENYLLSEFATLVTGIVRRGIESLTLPVRINDWIPRGTDLRIKSITGALIALENVTLTRINPNKLKYGFCYDDYEWWQKQPYWRRAVTERIPDRMQIISTEIETRIHFDYRLYQSLLVQQLRLGHGSGDVTLKGFVGMAVDLSTLGEAAILKCDGAFGVNDLVVDVHTDILGAKLGIDTVDGARANTTQYIIEQFMPLIAQQLDEIICNGDGLVDVRLYNSVSGGYVDSFPGLAHSINVALADRLSLVRNVQSYFEDDSKRRKKAARDCQRLISAGIVPDLEHCKELERFGDDAPSPHCGPALPRNYSPTSVSAGNVKEAPPPPPPSPPPPPPPSPPHAPNLSQRAKNYFDSWLGRSS